MSLENDIRESMRGRHTMLLREQNELNSLAIAENRDFTSEEQVLWDKRDAELSALTAQLRRQNALGDFSVDSRDADDVAPCPEHRVFVSDSHNGRLQECITLTRSARQVFALPNDFDAFRILHAKLTGNRRYLSDAEKRAMSGASDTGGGYSLDVLVMASIVDQLRANVVGLQAGAVVAPMQSARARWLRIDSDPTFTWAAEAQTLTESSPIFSTIEARPRTLRTFVQASSEILADSENAIEALRLSVISALARGLDDAILSGGTSGDAIEPVGIRNTSGVNTVTGAGTPTDYSSFATAVEKCRTANAVGQLSMVLHPRTAGTLDRLADTTGQPMNPPGSVRGLNRFETSAISITEGAGSNESFAIVGPFEEITVAMRMDAQLIEGPIEPASFQRQFVAGLRADVIVPRPAAFTIVSGITA